MKKAHRTAIRWTRIAILFMRLVILVFLGRSLQTWLSPKFLEHENVIYHGVAIACLAMVLLFVITPLLKECGEKVQALPWKRDRRDPN